MSSSSSKQRVVIIGAGPSGLYCAKELLKANNNLEVVIVEATERVGGRILSYQLRERFPQSTTHIECGPEFIHGESENLFLDLVNQRHPDGSGVLELDYPNYFYFGKEGKFLSSEKAFEEMKDLKTAFDVYDNIEEEDLETTKERSLLQYFTEKNVSSRVLDVADAIFANDYGAEMSQIGLKETIIEQQRWNYGEKYLVLTKDTFSEIIQDFAKGLPIQNEWVVSEIDYTSAPQKVLVKNTKGQSIEAARVVISVPISVLQRGEIRFTPTLPPKKYEAFQAVRLGNAMKIIVVVNNIFWPKDFYDAICSDCFVPEIWLTPSAAALKGDLPAYTIIGFITGDRANRVLTLGEPEIKRLFLHQLDCMFGSVQNPSPATSSCIGFMVRDWHNEKFFYGAYTHPSLGAETLRPVISEPVANSLFFCGEATHTGINPCIHGAFETAVRAASQVLSSLSQSKL